eukprot:Nitzschia sp. Nitz4//scaffold44_size153857//12474//17017//NITZ4_002696-RA/size153857-snap-gene-0.201-mRNA-1//-1//CDS//3329552082//1936//frame0
MAKKNKKRDARGYGQQTTTTVSANNSSKAQSRSPKQTTASNTVSGNANGAPKIGTSTGTSSAGAPMSTTSTTGTTTSSFPATPTMGSLAPTPLISLSTFQKLQSILQDIQSHSDESRKTAAVTAAAIEPARFPSKLGSIVDRLLVDLKFTEGQVEQVVQALTYDITLPSALNWLCLHLSPAELPSLFTEGLDFTQDSSNQDSRNVVTVLPMMPSQRTDTNPKDAASQVKETRLESSTSPPVPPMPLPESTTKQQTSEDEEAKAKQKAWLLERYAMMEDEENQKEEPCNSVGGGESTTPALEDCLPEELELQQQEQELAELAADVNNDANNYMRSKQEIRQLKAELRQKQQLVSGLRKRAEKLKAKKKKEEPQPVAIIEKTTEAEDEGGGFVDIFGSSGQDSDEEGGRVESGMTDSQAPTLVPTEVPKSLIDAIIQKSWTGSTPKKVLDERCKKMNIPKPKYTQLPNKAGFRLQVSLKKKQPPKSWDARHSDFTKGSSLQDYLALLALYGMDPNLELYRMFPPSFADMWLSWNKEVEMAKSEETKALDEKRRVFLDRLLALVKESAGESIGRGKVAPPCDHDDAHLDEQDSVPDEWDESDSDVEVSQEERGPSPQGLKLRDNFERRKQSSVYQKMYRIRQDLPVSVFRDDILRTISNHPVTILSAQTGAGKTTQCPQFLLEHAMESGMGDKTEILVTQPRRVAATSVAERVAEEMGEPKLGGLVGYKIRMDAKYSAETRLCFCTTGILLRRLHEDRDLAGVSHVVVDEVHERQQQTDVLLIALRELLRTTRPDLKIILMSATMDSELFCSFFGAAPLIQIPGRTFPVANYFLEDLLDATDYIIEEGSMYAKRDDSIWGEKATLWVTNRGGDKRREVVDLGGGTLSDDALSEEYQGYKLSTRKSMERVREDVVNFELVEEVLELILCKNAVENILEPPEGADMSSGSIIVFLPGLAEIRTMMERLLATRSFSDNKRFVILALHSTLPPKEQRRAFQPSAPDCRKIILSTNIAETSVTIPDVVCVIDSGRVREIHRNIRTSTSFLETTWCSQASSQQRAGRAGRVQPGLCLKLYSRHTASKTMKPTSEPELQRIPLEEVCLSILASGLTTNCMDFLSQAPQPPPTRLVDSAITTLLSVGAVTESLERQSDSRTIQQLTPLGKHMAKLPVDVKIAKLLIWGVLFRCLDTILTIAACLSAPSPVFTTPNAQEAAADAESDFITLCKAWEDYVSKTKGQSSRAVRHICEKNGWNAVGFRDISEHRKQLLDLLCGMGLVSIKRVTKGKDPDTSVVQLLPDSWYNTHGHNPRVIHAVLAAGLWPHVAQVESLTSARSYRGRRLFYDLREGDNTLHFHRTSVFSRRERLPNCWVVFYEKFGQGENVSISTAGLLDPLGMLLLGGNGAEALEVVPLERRVCLDDWVNVAVSGQVGVMLKTIRNQFETLLEIEWEGKQGGQEETTRNNAWNASFLDKVVDLFA